MNYFFACQKRLTLLLLFGALLVMPLAYGQGFPLNQIPKLDMNDLPTLKEVRDAYLPWLKPGVNASECAQFIDELFENPKKYVEPFMATGKKINDYGDVLACSRLENFTYTLMMMKSIYSTQRTLIGLCGPKTCSIEHYQSQEPAIKPTIAKVAGLNESNFEVKFYDPVVETNKIHPDTGTYVTIGVIATIILLGTIGSCYDLQAEAAAARKNRAHSSVGGGDGSVSTRSTEIDINPADPENASISSYLQMGDKPQMDQKLLTQKRHSSSGRPRCNFSTICKCFSFYGNAKKLFSTSKITDENASTECLNGFRVLTMCWVILGHTYFYHLRSPNLNLSEWLVFLAKFRNQLFVSCPLSVDSFLCMGGFLGAYLMVKEIKKRKGRLNFFKVMFHRYYRIVPMYFLIILFGWKILPLFVVGAGGFNYKETTDYDCHDTWWSNLIFLNNFLPVGKISSCFGYTWYLAADMQCFVTLPIMLVIYYKNRRLGWIMALTLFFGSVIAWFISAFVGEWSPDLPWVLQHEDTFFDFYSKPYYRYGPYGVGVICGLVVSEFKDDTLPENIFAKKVYRFWRSRLMRYLTYIAGIMIILWAIFVNYPVNNGDVVNWSQFKRSIYLATHRSIWSLGWMLILMPAMMGWGTILRGILGANFWSPLARLTFGAYFVHPQLQLWYYWNLEQAWFISNINSFLNCAAFVTISYTLSACFSLLAESPSMNLEKFWMPPRRPQEAGKESKH
mgnify:CR=1 FL=1